MKQVKRVAGDDYWHCAQCGKRFLGYGGKCPSCDFQHQMTKQNPEAMAAEAAQKSAEANVHYMAMKYYCDKEMPVFVDDDKGRQDTIEKAFVAGAEWQKSRAQQKPPMEAEEAAEKVRHAHLDLGYDEATARHSAEAWSDGYRVAKSKAEAEIAELKRELRDLKELEDIEIALAKSKTEIYFQANEKISTLEKRIEFLEQVEIRVKDKGLRERDERIAALESDCRLYAEEKVHLLKERNNSSEQVKSLTAKLAECEKRVEGLRNALESAKYQLECDRGKIVDASYTQGITEILGVVRKALLTKEAPAEGTWISQMETKA